MNAKEEKIYKHAFDLKNDGKVGEAIAEFKQILERYPDSGISTSMIASLYYSEINDPEKALPYAERAIELHPKSETASFCLSLCLFDLNRKDDMNSEVERYVKEGGKIDLYNTLFEENGLTIEDFT